MDEQDDTRLDNFLRGKLGAYRPAPTDAVWNAIETRLGTPAPPPPPRRAWSGHVLPALFAGLMGVLIGWLLPHDDKEPSALLVATTGTTSVKAPEVTAAPVSSLIPQGSAAASLTSVGTTESVNPSPIPQRTVGHSTSFAQARPRRLVPGQLTRTRYSTVTLPASAALASSNTSSTTGLAIPAVLLPLAAAETAVQAAPADSAATVRAHRQQVLHAERRELARLQRRADSLLNLLSLGAEATALTPTARAIKDDALPAARAVVVHREPRLAHRWLLALTGTPERSFLATAASADSLTTLRRHHEAGRTGLSAAVLAEYRVSERVSVGAGVGYTRLNTELRLTEQHTTVDVRYTTTTTVNGNQTIVTTTPILEQRTTSAYRVLRPTYHFLTVPVLVRYRLTPATRRTRCWADVAVGAQAQLFRGGTQLVSTDGRTFQTRRADAGDELFRPVTLAFTGALAVNYALTPRLTASVAPAGRWQTRSVYRAGAGLQQRPTSTGVQLGLHWTL